VVPTSLDQPETAVALGAHHVTADGISMRTRDLAGLPNPTPPGIPQAGPQTGPRPVQASPVGPPSGPQQLQPMPAAMQQPMQPGTQQLPMMQQPYQPQQQPKPKSGRRKMWLAVSGLVVLALLAVGAVFLFRPTSDLPTADDCQQKGDTDSKGFSSCLRQLAGAVADSSECGPADAGSGADVSCALSDDYQVSYAHVASVDDANKVANNQLGNMKDGTHVEADWRGNGLDGRFRAGVSGGTGMLVFTVKDRPLVGWLSKTDLRASDDFTPDSLADFFAQHVQPGT